MTKNYIDIDKEISQILSEEIANEIDREVLEDFNDMLDKERRSKLTQAERDAEDHEREADLIVDKLKKAPVKKWTPSHISVLKQAVNAPTRMLTAKWTTETTSSVIVSGQKKTKKPTK